jgi:Nucleotidyltransferase domain.
MITKDSIVSLKIEFTKSRILQEYTAEIKGIYIIGSFLKEYTPFSDLDLLVVFEDTFFNENFVSIKNKFYQISGEANLKYPEFELFIWFSKIDHYHIQLPDVSYIRANLPKTIDRLDSWFGLAKHTLISYEAESFYKIFGDFIITSPIKRIPQSESIELFLIVTRTFIDGIDKIYSEEENVRNIGKSHIAKSGLRAAYSALIYLDGGKRNSYKFILESALNKLPKEFNQLLHDLYTIKSQGNINLNLDVLLNFFHYVENLIADSPRLITSGLAQGSAGESFGFDVESFLGTNAIPKKNYLRFPNAINNYYQSIYFIISAYRAINILIDNKISNLKIIDFFFEELFLTTSLAIFCFPSYIKLVLGQKERQDIEIRFTLDMLISLQKILCTLFLEYAKGNDNYTTEWLPTKIKANYAGMLLIQINSLHKISIPEAENKIINDFIEDDVFVNAIVYQTEIFSGIYNLRFLEFMNSTGFSLLKAGRNEQAQKIFNTLIHLKDIKSEVLNELNLDQDSPKNIVIHELSKTYQFSAFTFQIQGNINEAKQRYLISLELNPDNYSALDDFNGLLIENNLIDENMQLLIRLIKKSSNVAEARDQVASRFIKCAIEMKQKHQYEISGKFYLKAIEIDPSNYKVYYNYGILLELFDTKLALEMYNKSIAMNVNYVLPYERIGLMYENTDDWENALKYYKTAEQKGIANEHIFNNLGNYYLKKNELNIACDYYKKALNINNHHSDALNGLGNVLMIVGVNTHDIEILKQAAYCFSESYISDPTFEGAKTNYNRVVNLINKLGPE